MAGEDSRIRIRDPSTAARERDAFVEVVARIAEKGFALQKLPEGYNKPRWGLLSDEERQKQDAGIRVVCWHELYDIPKGSVGKVIGYWSKSNDIEVEWITVKDSRCEPILDSFSPEEFLKTLVVLSKQEYEQFSKALRPSARG